MKSFFWAFFFIIFCTGCEANTEFPVLFKASKRLVSPYGVCTHINRIGPMWEYDSKDKDLSMICNVGAGFIRTDFDWGYCQPKLTNSFSFSHHDKMMASVDSLQLLTLGIFSSPKVGHFNEWKKYVSQVTSHFKSRINYWEVINEADLWHRRQSGYSANDYSIELKTASQLIRSANKKAKILFSGISNVKVGFIEKVFEQKISDCFDIMNIHWYSNKNNEPESFFAYFKQLHDIMQLYKVDKPVWFTETGCTTSPGYADENIQARRLPRIFLISFACGIDKVFWYKSRSRELSDDSEDHYGLWHKDYLPKPAYYAYKTLTNMCPSGSTRPKISKKGNVYVAVWKQPKGKNVTALWTSKGVDDVNIKSFIGDIYDINGNKISVASERMEISTSILYFVSSKKLVLNQ